MFFPPDINPCYLLHKTIEVFGIRKQSDRKHNDMGHQLLASQPLIKTYYFVFSSKNCLKSVKFRQALN